MGWWWSGRCSECNVTGKVVRSDNERAGQVWWWVKEWRSKGMTMQRGCTNRIGPSEAKCVCVLFCVSALDFKVCEYECFAVFVCVLDSVEVADRIRRECLRTKLEEKGVWAVPKIWRNHDLFVFGPVSTVSLLFRQGGCRRVWRSWSKKKSRGAGWGRRCERRRWRKIGATRRPSEMMMESR